jgi:hypothetical protein
VVGRAVDRSGLERGHLAAVLELQLDAEVALHRAAHGAAGQCAQKLALLGFAGRRAVVVDELAAVAVQPVRERLTTDQAYGRLSRTHVRSSSSSTGPYFHDLRHTGNTLAAATGPSLRDLMARMRPDSPDAALIYQHATSAADQAIAQALGEAMSQTRDDGDQDDDPDEGAAGVAART